MPRGMYDRTKTKEQRAAEKAAGKAPKAKKTFTRKGKMSYSGPVLTKATSSGDLETDHKRLEILENYFTILTQAKGQKYVEGSHKLDKAIEGTLDKMEQLAARIYPGEIIEAKTAVEIPSVKNGRNLKSAPPEALPAPTAAGGTSAFNPTVPV